VTQYFFQTNSGDYRCKYRLQSDSSSPAPRRRDLLECAIIALESCPPRRCPLADPLSVENGVIKLLARWKYPQIIFIIWALLALVVLFPVTRLLNASFPIFTILWIIIPLVAVMRSKDTDRVGFRIVPGRQLIQTTAINLSALLAIMLIFEPWSHTYQKLLALVLSSHPPDTTFAWLLRFPRISALGAMALYSGLVTLFGEELFFRGWLLQLLQKRLGRNWAVVIQSLLFVLPNLLAAFALPSLQGWLYGLIYTGLAIGMVGGWAAARTGSIWPSLISATVCNLILVALVL
jgi:membrane protease YdiL (CAAX protease family)